MVCRNSWLGRLRLGTVALLALSLTVNAQDIQQRINTQRSCPSNRLVQPKSVHRITERPSCPDGNGDIFTTEDGAHWTLLCCTHGKNAIRIPGTTSIVPNLQECATKCSTTNNCQSFLYSVNNDQDVPSGTCALYSTGGFSTVGCVDDRHDYAYITTPPGIDSPDTLTVACPDVKCPIVNRPISCSLEEDEHYKSQSGELFHVDCAKRHGTSVVYEDEQPTFEDCMNACSKYIPCHSVDYHHNSKKCYYSNHHGKPSLMAPGFQSAFSLGCVSACGCGSDNSEKPPPGGPGGPDDREIPGGPGGPDDRETPGGPGDPDEREIPGGPGGPDDRGIPGGPGGSDDRGIPGGPGGPDDREIPGGPGGPDDGRIPGGPGGPDDRGIPGGPGGPDDREIPGPGGPGGSGGSGGHEDTCDTLCRPPYVNSRCGIVDESTFIQLNTVWKAFCSGYSDGRVILDLWVDSPKECVEACTSDSECTHANWALEGRPSDGKLHCYTKKNGMDKSPRISNAGWASIFRNGQIVWLP